MGRRMSGFPYSVCCHYDPVLHKWGKLGGWMDGCATLIFTKHVAIFVMAHRYSNSIFMLSIVHFQVCAVQVAMFHINIKIM